MEPLLGPINIGTAKPDWIITGGESGPHFRPLDMDAVRSLRRVAFHHKQNGGIHGKAKGCVIDGVEHKDFRPCCSRIGPSKVFWLRSTKAACRTCQGLVRPQGGPGSANAGSVRLNLPAAKV